MPFLGDEKIVYMENSVNKINKRKKEYMRGKNKNKGMRKFTDVSSEKQGRGIRSGQSSLKDQHRQYHRHRGCYHLHTNLKSGDHREQVFEKSQRFHVRNDSHGSHNAHWQGMCLCHSIEHERRRLIRRIRHLQQRLRVLNHHSYGRPDRAYRMRMGYHARVR